MRGRIVCGILTLVMVLALFPAIPSMTAVPTADLAGSAIDIPPATANDLEPVDPVVSAPSETLAAAAAGMAVSEAPEVRKSFNVAPRISNL